MVLIQLPAKKANDIGQEKLNGATDDLDAKKLPTEEEALEAEEGEKEITYPNQSAATFLQIAAVAIPILAFCKFLDFADNFRIR